jgi:hypothetical protein
VLVGIVGFVVDLLTLRVCQCSNQPHRRALWAAEMLRARPELSSDAIDANVKHAVEDVAAALAAALNADVRVDTKRDTRWTPANRADFDRATASAAPPTVYCLGVLLQADHRRRRAQKFSTRVSIV